MFRRYAVLSIRAYEIERPTQHRQGTLHSALYFSYICLSRRTSACAAACATRSAACAACDAANSIRSCAISPSVSNRCRFDGCAAAPPPPPLPLSRHVSNSFKVTTPSPSASKSLKSNVLPPPPPPPPLAPSTATASISKERPSKPKISVKERKSRYASCASIPVRAFNIRECTI